MTDERRQRLLDRMDAIDAEKESAEPPPLPMRRQVSRFLSTAFLFLGITVLAILGRSLWRDYSGWRYAGNDSSAREAYVTFIEVDVTLVVLTVAAVIGAAALLRWWADREPD